MSVRRNYQLSLSNFEHTLIWQGKYHGTLVQALAALASVLHDDNQLRESAAYCDVSEPDPE